MRKHISKILCSLLTMSLVFSSIPVFATTNSTINIDTKHVTSMKDDVDPSWNFSNSSVISIHLPSLEAANIATDLRGLFWGSITTYYQCSDDISKVATDESLSDIYAKISYYWTYSGDNNTPYYIKKFVTYYSDVDLKHYISSSTVYYYSDTTDVHYDGWN